MELVENFVAQRARALGARGDGSARAGDARPVDDHLRPFVPAILGGGYRQNGGTSALSRVQRKLAYLTAPDWGPVAELPRVEHRPIVVLKMRNPCRSRTLSQPRASGALRPELPLRAGETLELRERAARPLWGAPHKACVEGTVARGHTIRQGPGHRATRSWADLLAWSRIGNTVRGTMPLTLTFASPDARTLAPSQAEKRCPAWHRPILQILRPKAGEEAFGRVRGSSLGVGLRRA